jgi:hypothetical protein
LPPAAAGDEGRPRLHPTAKLPIPAVNTIHSFSAQSKLTRATLSLLPHWSSAAATMLKLQSVKGQPIKMRNFVNMRAVLQIRIRDSAPF